METLSLVLKNKIFLSTLSAWVIAQFLKMLIFFMKKGRVDFRLLVGQGGMPSSHSSAATALAVSVGRVEGWCSSIFMVTLILAVIIMTDAVGVRRAAGHQARVLNKMIEDLYEDGRVGEGRLKELLGHTPIEVIVGGVLGISLALMWT